MYSKYRKTDVSCAWLVIPRKAQWGCNHEYSRKLATWMLHGDFRSRQSLLRPGRQFKCNFNALVIRQSIMIFSTIPILSWTERLIFRAAYQRLDFWVKEQPIQQHQQYQAGSSSIVYSFELNADRIESPIWYKVIIEVGHKNREYVCAVDRDIFCIFRTRW